ncbi:hypothetical protein BJY17_002195 [Agromyces hippuratus]|uniref:Uncharacterized protein n=1 Tax=Agromyces hippuratus TaxID=286438 RepID=A0A852WV61_9MICO|nr:hypothetical protein [Agromyces hippuratus]NYG21448.1 hypothetical protein [Agromyces hippuratus]
MPWWISAAWAAAYLVAGAAWGLGASGYPFSGGGAGPRASVMDPLPSQVGGWILAGAAALAGVLVVLIARRPAARVPAAAAVLVGVALAVVLTDFRVLVFAAYLPVMAVAALLGHVDPHIMATMLIWPNINQMVLMIAGAGLTSLGIRGLMARNRAGEMTADHPAPGLQAATALRVGRWATGVAVVIPVGYAVTRIGWFAGVPIGISPSFMQRLDDAHAAPIGAGLGGVALLGAVLTLGLVCPWGEVWPRWVPFLRGRAIPPRLPASLAIAISLPIMSAGLMYVRKRLAGEEFGATGAEHEPGAWLPEMFFPLWGAALAIAALAYLHRRTAGQELLRRSTSPRGLVSG